MATVRYVYEEPSNDPIRGRHWEPDTDYEIPDQDVELYRGNPRFQVIDVGTAPRDESDGHSQGEPEDDPIGEEPLPEVASEPSEVVEAAPEWVAPEPVEEPPAEV